MYVDLRFKRKVSINLWRSDQRSLFYWIVIIIFNGLNNNSLLMCDSILWSIHWIHKVGSVLWCLDTTNFLSNTHYTHCLFMCVPLICGWYAPEMRRKKVEKSEMKGKCFYSCGIWKNLCVGSLLWSFDINEIYTFLSRQPYISSVFV